VEYSSPDFCVARSRPRRGRFGYGDAWRLGWLLPAALLLGTVFVACRGCCNWLVFTFRCRSCCGSAFPTVSYRSDRQERQHGGLAAPSMGRTAFSVALLLLLTGCSSASRGSLSPVAESGVTLVSTEGLPDDTARLSGSGVTADVTGRWSQQNETIEIRYRAGAVPVRIAIRGGATGIARPATSAWDRTKPFPGNAIGRPLLDEAPLTIAANGEARVQIEFARANDTPLSIGDRVTLAVPMPDGARAVTFRAGGE
jgi:hypothetical protein